MGEDETSSHARIGGKCMHIQSYVYDEQNQPQPIELTHYVRLQGGFSSAEGFLTIQTNTKRISTEHAPDELHTLWQYVVDCFTECVTQSAGESYFPNTPAMIRMEQQLAQTIRCTIDEQTAEAEMKVWIEALYDAGIAWCDWLNINTHSATASSLQTQLEQLKKATA